MNVYMNLAYPLSDLPSRALLGLKSLISIIVFCICLLQHFYIILHTFFIDAKPVPDYTEHRLHRKSIFISKLRRISTMKQKLFDKFAELFGNSEGAHFYFAPGRVNLIGEHTDYNGGHVFPCALTMGTYGVARKRVDRKMNFYSMNLD